MEQNVVTIDNISFRYPETEKNVFTDLSLTLPGGMVSLVGQNGTGKSTLLLLIGGRVLPQEGTITLFGRDTRELQDETEKNQYASFIYQNMEFETEEPVGNLIDYVYENGFYEKKDEQFKQKLIDVMELTPALEKKTQEISKGELQRTIIAFSLLYGSKAIIMDEPIFALEEYQKERIMDYLLEFSRDTGVSIYFSVHDLDITKQYSTHMVLFHKDGTIVDGPTDELYEKDVLEKAYDVPFDMLKLKESMFRKDLFEIAKQARKKTNQ
jgi:ABC-type cobalamin/Fe3+-siderophores transport system ATPase subunit